MHEFYDKLLELIKANSKLALATVVQTTGSTPREVGAKMVVLVDGTTHGTLAGGKLELIVTQDAQLALQRNENVLKEYTLKDENSGGIGAICGGEAKVFIEIISQPDQLLILGGGHIGLALYRMGLELGFSVIVVDDRAEFSSQERFPGAVLLLNCPANDPRVKQLVNEDAYIVVITHEHKQDKLALKSLIDLDYKYMGMIGSKSKVKQTLSELEAEGVPREKLNEIFTPIGLDIKAETPAEIAVSILAEIIYIKNTGLRSKHSLVNKL